ncbi:MAG: four helix bundle protein [Calditrichia bacterium]
MKGNRRRETGDENKIIETSLQKESRLKKITKFEDLEVWKESMRLAVDIYHAFLSVKDYTFRDHIQRSAVSIPSNIAEGFDRNSNKEFIQYLFVSKGSCSELRTQLYLSNEFALIEIMKAQEFIERTKKISAMLYNLIKTRKEKF